MSTQVTPFVESNCGPAFRAQTAVPPCESPGSWPPREKAAERGNPWRELHSVREIQKPKIACRPSLLRGHFVTCTRTHSGAANGGITCTRMGDSGAGIRPALFHVKHCCVGIRRTGAERQREDNTRRVICCRGPGTAAPAVVGTEPRLPYRRPLRKGGGGEGGPPAPGVLRPGLRPNACSSNDCSVGSLGLRTKRLFDARLFGRTTGTRES